MKNENNLKNLQDELKKEWLLIERQQRQKNKMKKEIDENINNYFSIWVQRVHDGKITDDDGFGNCYNFVKDIVLSICKDVELGFTILSKGNPEFVKDMIGIFLNIFYENFCQNDPYYKNIIKFVVLLVKQIVKYIKLQGSGKQLKKVKIGKVPILLWEILRQYFLKDENRIYFEMKSNKVLSTIPVLLHTIQQNMIQRNPFQSCIQMNELKDDNKPVKITNSIGLQTLYKSFIGSSEEQINKKIEDITKNFVEDIIENAGLFPVGIKIILFIFKEELKQIGYELKIINEFLWTLLLPHYLRPLTNQDKRKWNHFRNSKFSDSLQQICELTQKSFSDSDIKKIIQKASSINKEKYDEILKKKSEVNNKIIVYGACLTFRQLQLLVKIVKENEEELKKLSERVVNRARRILEINPQLFIFTDVPNPNSTYVVFKELSYGQIIQRDYMKQYNSTYKQDKVKNILLQILSDNTFNLPSYYNPNYYSLKQVLQKISEAQELGGDGIYGSSILAYTSEFNMKIKYLIWLLERQNIDEGVYIDMIEECKERQDKFISLFQNTKFEMLRSLTHIQKIKSSTTKRRQNQIQIQKHLHIVKILDNMDINLCITAPSTRQQKFKYIKANSSQIICQGADQCIHQENIIIGLNSHANSLWQAMEIFCALKQVHEALETGRQKFGAYQGLSKILEFIKKQYRTNYLSNIQEYDQFEKGLLLVVLRALHQILLQRGNPTTQDQQFEKKTKNLTFIEPRNILMKTYKNLIDFEQLWQITNRYIIDLSNRKTPIEKVEVLKQMLYIVQIALETHIDPNLKAGNYLQIIMAYCLIKAKPTRFISNINFIELFLTKDKLLSREGETLKKIKKSISFILDDTIVNFLKNIDQKEYNENLNRISMGQNYNSIKVREKQQNLLPFL